VIRVGLTALNNEVSVGEARCRLAGARLANLLNDAFVSAISGKVTGNVQKVGFRAMIQKLAIQYNLAGSAENNTDGSVQFTLQGDNDRIKQAVKAISKGTKSHQM
jgi:acylphosphatase